MMYSLEKNSRGMITSQVRDGEAGNIYANRQAINKKALENLEKNTPSGKLGKLSNLQVFNFIINDIASGNADLIFVEYNDDPTVSINDCVMFSNGKSGDGLYYNVLDIKASINLSGNNTKVLADSYVQFYLLQNGTQPTGKKIPRTQQLFSSVTSPGSLTITTDGYTAGNQFVQTDLLSDSVIIPSDSNGLRCSGLALKTIQIDFEVSRPLADVVLEFQVYVDVTSVSRTY